ncbi:hypothetical protein ACLKA6_008465 [Drosophila palustris]
MPGRRRKSAKLQVLTQLSRTGTVPKQRRSVEQEHLRKSSETRQPGRDLESIPLSSELRSAINVALLQAHETYRSSQSSEFSNFKDEMRRKMLAFMKQIRETVRAMYAVDYAPAEQQQHPTLAASKTDSTPSTPQQLRAPGDPSAAPVIEADSISLDSGMESETPEPQQVQEPAIPLPSTIPQTVQNFLTDTEVSRESDAQMDEQISQHTEEHERSINCSSGQGAYGFSDSQSKQKAHQWPEVTIMRESQVAMDNRTEQWLTKQVESRKLAIWPNLRFCLQQLCHAGFQRRRVKKAEAEQAGENPGMDPVVEAPYRPRGVAGVES